MLKWVLKKKEKKEKVLADVINRELSQLQVFVGKS